MTHINEKAGLTLPLGVVIAGALIGLGIYLGAYEIAHTNNAIGLAPAPKTAVTNTVASPIKVASVTTADHIRGPLGAKVTVVEYTDLECPFCKQFHTTLRSVLSKFAPGEVAWVYRSFPLAMHDRAAKEAQAAECAAEQGGNAKFWAYVDRVFEITPGNNKLDPSELSKIASYIGLNLPAFETCLSSGKYQAKIDASIKEGTAAGAAGTPYSVLITKNGTTPVKGAIGADALEQKIREALGK